MQIGGKLGRDDLGPEQRRLLELVMCAQRGLTAATLMRVYGFMPDLLTGLVRDGLAEAAAGTVIRGSRTIHVARVRITNAGRRAIEG